MDFPFKSLPNLHAPFRARTIRTGLTVLYAYLCLYCNYFIFIFQIMPFVFFKNWSKTSERIRILFPILMTGIFCHVISFRRLFLPIPVYSDASFTVRAFFVCIVFCVCSVKDSPFFFPQKERFFIVLIYALLFFVHLPPFY